MIKSVTVGGVTYNVAQAPAIDQKKLLLLVGAKIAINSAAGQVDKISTQMLMGALMSMSDQTLDEVAGIVLQQCVVNGSTDKVDIHGFQGSMLNYFLLISEAIMINLSDFFAWLDNANADARSSQKAATS